MSNQAVQGFIQRRWRREEHKEIGKTGAAFKNIFSHHRPNDDPVQTITKTQKKWRPESVIY